MNATVPLEMCNYLLKEEDYVPFATAISHLNKWKQLLQVRSSSGQMLHLKINVFLPYLPFPGI